jgi:F-type H+-transporting ATPase subunit b
VLVEPFTILAQVVNFLVLVIVLKFLLYDRIVDVIDRRQARIDNQLAQARRREVRANEERQRHEDARRALDHDRARLMAAAREAADREERELLDHAREEVRALREQWLSGMARERSRILAELERRAAHEAIALGEQTLRDLADVRLEDQVVEVAMRRLATRREDLLTELGPTPHVTVHTAFPLDDPRRARIAAELHDLLGPDVDVGFERTPDLVCGLEVRAADHGFGWHVSSYLDELRRRVDGWLAEELLGDGDPPADDRGPAGAGADRATVDGGLSS